MHALDELRLHLDALTAETPADPESLAMDRDLAAVLANHLALALECVLDAASELLARRGIGTPRTFTECMEALAGAGLVDGATARAVSQLGGLRRSGADGYTGIDTQRLHAAASEGVQLLRSLERLLSSA